MKTDIRPQVALKSKKQGDVIDFRVLAQSEGPLSNKDFEALFNQLSVGNMPDKPRYEAERPPWVTFGPFKLGGAAYIAATRQDWTARNDRSSRPVSATVGLCLQYGEVAAEAPTYTLLHDQIPRSGSLMHSEGASLEPPRVSLAGGEGQWEAVAGFIEKFGFDFCAAVAALLIQSPVALVNGYDLGSDIRLSFIDAVASLLPFGARADLSASTWMQSASSSAMRLGFTDQARPGQQQRVAWGEPGSAKLEPGSKAKKYYQLLLDIKGRRGLPYLVTSLAGCREPITFGEGDAFLNALRSTDRLYLLWQDLKAGQASADEVRTAFELNGLSHLPEDKQCDLLAVLVDNLQSRDLSILRQRWVDGLQPRVCEAISSRLQAPEFQSELLWGLYQLADEKKWLARYVEALLRPMAEAVEPRPDAVKLLYNGLQRLGAPGSHAETQRIWKMLSRRRRLLYELGVVVIYECEVEREVKAWLAWLAGDDAFLKGEFDVFAAAAGLRKKAVTPEQLEEVGRVPGHFVRVLVRAAMSISQTSKDVSILERLVNAVSAWLLNHVGEMEEDEAQRWCQLLPALTTVPLDSDLVHARWDAVYLAVMPKDSELLLDPYLCQRNAEFNAYLKKFIPLLDRLGQRKQRAIGALAARCRTLPLRAEEQAVNLLHLLADLVPVAQEEAVKAELADAVVRVIESRPDLLSHPVFVTRLKQYLLVERGSTHLFRVLETKLTKSLCEKRPTAEVTEIVAEMLSTQAMDRELKVIKILDLRGFLCDPAQVEDFIKGLDAHLGTHGARDKVRDFHRSLLKYDSDAANLYLQYATTRAVNRLKEDSDLFEVVGEFLNEKLSIEAGAAVDKISHHVKREGLLRRGFAFLQPKKNRP